MGQNYEGLRICEAGIIEVVRAAQPLNLDQLLNECKEWLRIRSRILYCRFKDLFRGMNEDDAFNDLQQIFAKKVVDHGFPNCDTDAGIIARVRSFLYYSGKELVTFLVRNKCPEVLLPDDNASLVAKKDSSAEDAGSVHEYEATMREIALRQCMADLPTQKQRLFAVELLCGEDRVSIAAAWGASKQSIHALYHRTVSALRACMESKKEAL